MSARCIQWCRLCLYPLDVLIPTARIRWVNLALSCPSLPLSWQPSVDRSSVQQELLSKYMCSLDRRISRRISRLYSNVTDLENVSLNKMLLCNSNSLWNHISMCLVHFRAMNKSVGLISEVLRTQKFRCLQNIHLYYNPGATKVGLLCKT